MTGSREEQGEARVRSTFPYRSCGKRSRTHQDQEGGLFPGDILCRRVGSPKLYLRAAWEGLMRRHRASGSQAGPLQGLSSSFHFCSFSSMAWSVDSSCTNTCQSYSDLPTATVGHGELAQVLSPLQTPSFTFTKQKRT